MKTVNKIDLEDQKTLPSSLFLLPSSFFPLPSSLSKHTVFCARTAPLIPKLRGHFAEFLNNTSLAGLRILSSPTCVGLRYGHHNPKSIHFSRQCRVPHFATQISLPP